MPLVPAPSPVIGLPAILMPLEFQSIELPTCTALVFSRVALIMPVEAVREILGFPFVRPREIAVSDIDVFPMVREPVPPRSTSFTSDTVSVPLLEATEILPVDAVSPESAPPLIVTVFAFFTIEVPVSPAKEILELISCATFTASVSNLPAATFVI